MWELAGFQRDKRKGKRLKNKEVKKEKKKQTDKKKDVRKGDRGMEKSTEYKVQLIRLIGMTYHLLVSMTTAVTSGK